MLPMRIKYLLPVLFLGACQVNVAPAVDGADQLKTLFEREQANTRALVASANPPAATFQQFTMAQDASKEAFLAVHSALLANLASLGGYSPEELDALLERLVQLREATK